MALYFEKNEGVKGRMKHLIILCLLPLLLSGCLTRSKPFHIEIVSNETKRIPRYKSAFSKEQQLWIEAISTTGGDGREAAEMIVEYNKTNGPEDIVAFLDYLRVLNSREYEAGRTAFTDTTLIKNFNAILKSYHLLKELDE